MEKRLIIPILIVLGLLAVTLSVLSLTIISHGETKVSRGYSYTKAICDENSCQDYVIVCEGPEVISQTPIEGAQVQYPLNWKDPRSQEVINGFCLLH